MKEFCLYFFWYKIYILIFHHRTNYIKFLPHFDTTTQYKYKNACYMLLVPYVNVQINLVSFLWNTFHVRRS